MANALKNRDGVRGIAVVVAPHHRGVGGIGTEHHHAHVLPQRQDVLVLQQHYTLAGQLQCRLLVLPAADDVLGNRGPGHEVVAIEVAEVEASLEQTSHAHVDLFLGDFACRHRLGQRLVVRAALHVGAGAHSLCRRLVGIG